MTVMGLTGVGQQELLWAWLALLFGGVVFRLALPAQRRALWLTWTASAVGAGAVLLLPHSPMYPTLVSVYVGVALALWGLGVIHLAALSLFRGILPALGVAIPRIAHDLTLLSASVVWGALCLRWWGVDATHLFTTSAVITAVLAFAMQDTLGNVLGGVTLQLDNSLRVGDWVRVDDVSGRVTDVHWRFTSLVTRNREQVIVPNSWLMKNRFTVLRGTPESPYAWRRVVSFNVVADADPSRVLHVLEHAVSDAEIPNVLKEPPPSAVLGEIAYGYSRYSLRYWLADPQFDDPTDSSVRIHALAALARAGMAIGVPQEERLMVKENDSWRAAQEQREATRRLHAIRRTELFAHLPAEEQSMLAKHLIHAPFVAGDIITRQGAVAHWLYLIVQGEAQVFVEGPQGSQGRLAVATLRDGAFFGEMGMLTGEPRSATVMAVTGVDCYRLDKAGFAQVLQQRPDIAKEITAIVEARNAQRTVLLAQAGTHVRPSDDLLERIRRFFS